MVGVYYLLVFLYYVFTALTYLVFIDVILSWLMIFGIKFRPRIISDIINPIYNFIKKYVPTTFGIIDFTPIFVLIFCQVGQYFVWYLANLL